MLVLCFALVWAALPASAAVTIEGFETFEPGTAGPGYRGQALAVDVRSGSHFGLSRFVGVPGSPNEAWFRYMLSLDDWSPSQSGKLPGFAGLRSRTARGCLPATSEDPGWSARMMYRAAGTMGANDHQSRIGFYVYHLDQPKDCGEIMEWNDNALLDAGRWYCIEGHARLNDVGKANGSLRGWVDGHPAFERNGLRFRDSESLGIDDFWMNVYSGGKRPSPERLALRIDEVALSTTGRLGCPDAFDDDEEDANEQAINRLAEMDVFPGCGDFRACPNDPITRGDFFAMVAGVVDFPPGPDAFDDDTGHRAAPAIDALAAAGVISGCTPHDVCPDEAISRADAAGVLVQVFDLPPGDPIVFEDIADPDTAATAGALASAGVAAGCGRSRFCPEESVTRSQAAALVANAITQDRMPTVVSGPSHRPTLVDAYARQRSFLPALAGLVRQPPP